MNKKYLVIKKEVTYSSVVIAANSEAEAIDYVSESGLRSALDEKGAWKQLYTKSDFPLSAMEVVFRD